VSLRNALAHLTALRIPPRTRVPLVHSLHYFPWVGAAHGSINVLVFVAVSHFLPAAIACALAVLLPQVLAGFGPWRGLMEAGQGLRTPPGQAYYRSVRIDLRGALLVGGITLLKWLCLMLMSADWRVRSVLIFPILGMTAHTWAFLRHAHFEPVRNPLLARRRVRAGFLSAVCLFLTFLFPLRVAFVVLAALGFAFWLTLRLRHPRTSPAPTTNQGDLTLQTAGVMTEVAETTILVAVVAAGLLLV
jgi:cobalamin synthase